MKPITVKAAGKGWNARTVAAMTKEVFIKDEAHAVEGESADSNATILAKVWDDCTAAVKAADAPKPAPPADGSKKK